MSKKTKHTESTAREFFEEGLPLVDDGETTSAEVASIAGKLLNDPETSAEVKSVAASALTQAKDHHIVVCVDCDARQQAHGAKHGQMDLRCSKHSG